jgi:hypothetical protein
LFLERVEERPGFVESATATPDVEPRILSSREVLNGLADATGHAQGASVEADSVQICALAAVRLQYGGRRALNSSRLAWLVKSRFAGLLPT